MSDISASVLADLSGLSAAFSQAVCTPLTVSVMSPLHSAVENDLWRVVTPDGTSYVLRRLHDEMRAEFDIPAMIAGATAASDLGIGPKIIAADARDGVLLMEHLGAGWRTATMFDFKQPFIRKSVIHAARRLHEAEPIVRIFDPFAKLKQQIGSARRAGVSLPDDIDWLEDAVAQIEQACKSIPAERVLCRNDGCSSNVMIHDDGRLMLLDFDQAGMNDPAYDLGVLIAENAEFDDEALVWVEEWSGQADRNMLARAQLYGAIDDLLWGVMTAIRAHLSKRITIEFRKYSEWRFMRARRLIMDRRFEQMIRLVEAG